MRVLADAYTAGETAGQAGAGCGVQLKQSVKGQRVVSKLQAQSLKLKRSSKNQAPAAVNNPHWDLGFETWSFF
jgi:hypothetical protein